MMKEQLSCSIYSLCCYNTYILSGITHCKILNYLTWPKKVPENKTLLGVQNYCAYRTNTLFVVNLNTDEVQFKKKKV